MIQARVHLRKYGLIDKHDLLNNQEHRNEKANITNRLGNPNEYDAFAINMVKTDNASAYTSLLSK